MKTLHMVAAFLWAGLPLLLAADTSYVSKSIDSSRLELSTSGKVTFFVNAGTLSMKGVSFSENQLKEIFDALAKFEQWRKAAKETKLKGISKELAFIRGDREVFDKLVFVTADDEALKRRISARELDNIFSSKSGAKAVASDLEFYAWLEWYKVNSAVAGDGSRVFDSPSRLVALEPAEIESLLSLLKFLPDMKADLQRLELLK